MKAMNNFHPDHLEALKQAPAVQRHTPLIDALNRNDKALYLRLLQAWPGLCACKYCLSPTAMTGTKLCDECWQAERSAPSLLKMAHTKEGIDLLHIISQSFRDKLETLYPDARKKT